MNSSERRIDTRINIRVPVRFRLLTNPSSPEQIAESENISQRGLYFFTTFPLKIGTPLEISIRMPKELAGQDATEVRCMARVVHLKSDAAAGAKFGVGLHIERYTVNMMERERWAS